MSLASLGQSFVSARTVAPGTSSPVPMLPLAQQRYRASGDGRLFRLGTARDAYAELGEDVRAAIDEVFQEAYPVDAPDAPTPEEHIAEEAAKEETVPESAVAEDEPAPEREAEETPEEHIAEEAAKEETVPESAVAEDEPAPEREAEETPEEPVPEETEPAPEEAQTEREPAAEEAQPPPAAAEEEQPTAEEAQPAVEESSQPAPEQEQPAVEESLQPAAAEEEEEPTAEEAQPAVEESSQPAPEQEQPAAEGASQPAVEEAQEATSESSLTRARSSGLSDTGQPLFTTTSNRAYDRFRHKGYAADQKALAAGDDDAKAASAYIFDGDDATAAAFLGGDKRDLLAEAMRDDPERHAYLPPMFQGFDMQDPNWKHQPLKPRGGGTNRFKVCLDQGSGSWDAAYASNTLYDLFRGGVCFAEITESECENADVVIFNEGVFLWGGGHRNAQGAIELPPKSDPNQVYMYFAHEAAGTFGWELKDENVMKQFDYLAYFDRETSAVWWPFGPTVRSMLQDFKFFARPRENRVPGVAWLATDCKPLRATILQEIADKFPVFSLGSCQNNAAAPFGLPGRGDGDAAFQDLMSNYMFYFAVENGGACPAYATEKVFLALTRGSVPIYFGDEKAIATMPSNDSFVDLRTFDTPEKLAARLHAIATDREAYDEVHAWRYRHPSEWSEGFRALLRVMSTDIKYGVCDVLRKGPHDAVPAKAQADCDYQVTVMGRNVAAWPDHGGVRNPLEHLNKKCEHAKEECWEFKHPQVYERWGEQGAAEKSTPESSAESVAARRFLRQ